MGAQDYLVKGKATGELLVRSIKYAIERQRLTTALREEIRTKTLVLSTATHELKTPLTSIVGYVDRLLLNQEQIGPLNERQSRYLETVQKNARRLGALVDDLLDVSRIEAGSLELSLVDLDVLQEVREVIQVMGHQINEKQLNLVLDIPSDICRVTADRLRFSQVISNLVSNAGKYSPPGSTVKITSNECPTMVEVDISDSGIGISKEDQDMLFTKFLRSENELTRKEPGTGLGLYITKHLVEGHGGSINVGSELGKGTSFHLTWPKAA